MERVWEKFKLEKYNEHYFLRMNVRFKRSQLRTTITDIYSLFTFWYKLHILTNNVKQFVGVVNNILRINLKTK